jgi:hypothetical protein
MEFEGTSDQEQFGNGLVNSKSKRWDNKTTPNKQWQMLSENDNYAWQTPDSTPRQNQVTKGGQKLLSEVEHFSLGLSSQGGEDGNISRSDDEDITMRDSGNQLNPPQVRQIRHCQGIDSSGLVKSSSSGMQL